MKEREKRATVEVELRVARRQTGGREGDVAGVERMSVIASEARGEGLTLCERLNVNVCRQDLTRAGASWAAEVACRRQRRGSGFREKTRERDEVAAREGEEKEEEEDVERRRDVACGRRWASSRASSLPCICKRRPGKDVCRMQMSHHYSLACLFVVAV